MTFTYFQKYIFDKALVVVGFFVLCVPLAHAVSVQEGSDDAYTQFFVEDGESVTLSQKDFREWFVVDTQLIFDLSYRSQMENTQALHACPTDHPGCAFLVSSRFSGHVRKQEGVVVRTDDVRRFVRRLADDLYQAPVDARFRMIDGRVTAFGVHKDGREVLVDEGVAVIAQYARSIMQGNIPQTIKLPSRVIKPQFTMGDVNDLGIRELIGEGRSSFAGSPPTRVHNIRTAAKKFNGIILAPGEELSFVDLLGPVDATTGYAKELVIKDNQTKPEYGGGICQVSTTLFRSAILTGLEITQRRNHSYPVKYYEPTGFDATIYIPNPDLRFRNNTEHHILLENFIDGTDLVFRIYGTADGRRVDMKGPVVTESNPDGSMKTYFTQKVLRADGTVMIDDIFYSNYKSPNDYPHPGDISQKKLTQKPKNWSKKEWAAYKAENGL